MTKLSDTQLVLLSNAAKRDDGALMLSVKLKGHTGDQVIETLLRRKLCKAVPKEGQLPLWKHCADDGPLSLVITPKGLAAIGVDTREGGRSDTPSPKEKSAHKVQKEKSRKKPVGATKSRQANSKIAKVVDLLRKPSGATIKAIMSATGWQAHSVRGAISGAIKKKLGLKVSSDVRGDERVYRISA